MAISVSVTYSMSHTNPNHSSERALDFNANWSFFLGDVPEAKQLDYDSSSWRTLCLPHDWSVEHPFRQEQAGGATAFLPGGIGWYRKAFYLPESQRDQITWIEFDGIYNNSEVWINGHSLGMRPYGYVPFSYELTEHLRYGAETNVIAVRVDRSAYLDCRWYPGSGIYRDVKLVSAPKVHIPQWGTYVTTPVVDSARAEVVVATTVRNQDDAPQAIQLATSLQLLGNEGALTSSSVERIVDAGAEVTIEQLFELHDPELWDTESPTLYTAQSELISDLGQDVTTTTFGIRHIRYDSDTGFYLNGKPTLLKGVCLHHDGGCVGAAVPLAVWERRLRKLKALGCNAIRTAHNPPSEAFLDLCDRMGFVVQDEIFDEWDYPKDKRKNYKQVAASAETEGYTRYFREWDCRDTEAMMRRDRNHPCIVMWSLGNEIEWTYPGYGDAAGYWTEGLKANYYWDLPPHDDDKRREVFATDERGEYRLAESAARLAEVVRAWDTTRPVTANMVMPSVSQFSGYADLLDIDGYSYRQVVYEYCRERSPAKLIVGTENWAQWSEWKPVLDHDYVAGIFIWPGISYLGEAPAWPQKANDCGLLDLAGFEKPSYQYFRSLWHEAPMVHITTIRLKDSCYRVDGTGSIVENPDNPRPRQWLWPTLHEHWNYGEGEEIYVEIYSNCDSVELSLNGRSVGVKNLIDCEDRIFRWVVPYEAGELSAVASSTGSPDVRGSLATTGKPETILLSIERPQSPEAAGTAVHLIAELADADGEPVRSTEREIAFSVDGARILGIDNGSSYSVQDYQSDRCETHKGRCLVVLKPEGDRSTFTVTASGPDFRTVTKEFNNDLE